MSLTICRTDVSLSQVEENGRLSFDANAWFRDTTNHRLRVLNTNCCYGSAVQEALRRLEPSVVRALRDYSAFTQQCEMSRRHNQTQAARNSLDPRYDLRALMDRQFRILVSEYTAPSSGRNSTEPDKAKDGSTSLCPGSQPSVAQSTLTTSASAWRRDPCHQSTTDSTQTISGMPGFTEDQTLQMGYPYSTPSFKQGTLLDMHPFLRRHI